MIVVCGNTVPMALWPWARRCGTVYEAAAPRCPVCGKETVK